MPILLLLSSLVFAAPDEGNANIVQRPVEPVAVDDVIVPAAVGAAVGVVSGGVAGYAAITVIALLGQPAFIAAAAVVAAAAFLATAGAVILFMVDQPGSMPAAVGGAVGGLAGAVLGAVAGGYAGLLWAFSRSDSINGLEVVAVAVPVTFVASAAGAVIGAGGTAAVDGWLFEAAE